MKTIFLDLDGVMVPMYGAGADSAMSKDNKWHAEPFSFKAVAILNHILKLTGAEIVLSSDWRNHYTLSEMREIFATNGVIKGPIAFTPNSKNYVMKDLEGGRAEEILTWVNHHKLEHWVAVDDLNMVELGKHFVHCARAMEGIKQSGLMDKIITALNHPSVHSKNK